jgi:hypothetical protein
MPAIHIFTDPTTDEQFVIFHGKRVDYGEYLEIRETQTLVRLGFIAATA